MTVKIKTMNRLHREKTKNNIGQTKTGHTDMFL